MTSFHGHEPADTVEATIGPMAYEPLDKMASSPTPAADNSAVEPTAEQQPGSAAWSGSLLSMMIRLSSDGAGPAQNGDPEVRCEASCNGGPLWLHGLWPCWGTLNVSCTTTEASWSQRASSAASREDGERPTAVSRRSLSHAKEEGAASWVGPWPSPVSSRSMSFSASCRGLWTGFFGRRCIGLTMMHSTAAWPTGEIDK